MIEQPLNATIESPWKQEINSNEVIVLTLQVRLGVRTVEDVFKKCFINGCGSAELSKEESGIVFKDVERFIEERKLPAYVLRTYSHASS